MNPVVFKAVQSITGLNHFYSQNDDHCVGALLCAATELGQQMSKEDALALVPELRGALETLSAQTCLVSVTWE